MIDEVLSGVAAKIQASPRCKEIKKVHLFNGLVPPATGAAISISCTKENFAEYDRDQDEVTATVALTICLKDLNPERGEKVLRALASEIRFVLLEDEHLDGLVDSLHPTDVTYETDDLGQAQLLHAALMDVHVKYYTPRQRPEDLPHLEELIVQYEMDHKE